MTGKYEMKKGPSGKFMFNLKAGNGQVILTSEQYNDKASAQNGIASVQKNCADDGRFERKKSKNGEPYFVLAAANGQTIGKSEMYTTDAAMENGIKSVKTNGSTTVIDDMTAV